MKPLLMTLTAVMCLAQAVSAQMASGPLSPFESDVRLTPQTQIDRLVLARLDKLGITPSYVCSDSVFVRRVYLDVIGTLPTMAEVKAFLADSSPNKRGVLIDRLLERDEFADYASLKWADTLRVKAEFPINLWPNAVQAYHRWIRQSLKENKPYDVFARELLTSSGSNFRVAPVNFYRATQNKEPAGLAGAVSLTFMGVRAESWPKDRLAGMSQFFTQINFKSTGEWKEEIIGLDLEKAGNGPPKGTIFPDGKAAFVANGQDPRVVFADWLIDVKNPWFARCQVNRTWSWLLGRGIVHEADDMRADNPPSNPELLAYLEGELIKAKWDVKHIYRLILNSKTYQLSSIPRGKQEIAEANFGTYPLRRIEAEVLADALNQITGTSEKYTSPIPEPFTFIPEEQRSILLADGSTTSSFLELFGRPPRDTGLASERNNKPSADQRLHMLNSSHIQRKLENSRKLTELMKPGGREVVENVYLTILSRRPTSDELKTFGAYANSAGFKGREAVLDLAWALINSAEFQYRH